MTPGKARRGARPAAGAAPPAPSLAIFTDTYDDINGVSTIYRQFVAAANDSRVPAARLTVFTMSDRTAQEGGPHAIVRHYRPRPRVNLPRYPDLQTGYPPRPHITADFASERFDAVVVATPGPVGFLGLALARRGGRPLVGFYHTRFPAYLAVYSRGLGPARYVPTMMERVGYRWMARLYGSCDLVVSQSATIGPEIRRCTSAPIAVWDTGVDVRRFQPGPVPEFRRRHGLPEDAVVITYVGRLAAEKGLDVLGELSHQLPQAHFLVVGDGPYAPVLQAGARATFTGFLQGQDLADAYASSDVFFFPSVTDTFGNVLLEAMASGLPLVVTTGGPGAELVACSGAGLTFAPDDVADAAAAVQRLLDHPEVRRAMAARARDHAVERDWPVAFARFVDLCRDAAPPPVRAEARTRRLRRPLRRVRLAWRRRSLV